LVVAVLVEKKQQQFSNELLCTFPLLIFYL